MTGLKVGMITYVQILGGLAPQKFGKARKSKIWPDFGQLSTLTANILGNSQDIKDPKQTWSTNFLVWFSKKICEVWSTNKKVKGAHDDLP